MSAGLHRSGNLNGRLAVPPLPAVPAGGQNPGRLVSPRHPHRALQEIQAVRISHITSPHSPQKINVLFHSFVNFRHGLRGGNSTKLTTMVDFPVYGFDMTPHLANKRNTLNRNESLPDNDGSVIINNGWSPWRRARKQSNSSDNLYDLYAVCYHHGTDLETGHYTAACKNPYDGQWYLYDDAKVVNLSKQSNDIGNLPIAKKKKKLP